MVAAGIGLPGPLVSRVPRKSKSHLRVRSAKTFRPNQWPTWNSISVGWLRRILDWKRMLFLRPSN